MFKLKLSASVEANKLNGTSKENRFTYDDDYNLLVTSSSTTKRGNSIDQTVSSQIEYEAASLNSPYRLGFIKKKASSVTHDGDTKTAEELYTYSDNLVKTIQKKGHNTAYITQTNDYDTFGNLIKSSVQAGNAPARNNKDKSRASSKLTPVI